MKYEIQFENELRRNPFPGFFIALEGIDGSGKTSQIESLKNFFEKQGREVFTFHWVRKDKGLVANITKQYLSGHVTLPKPAMQYLFSADYVLFSEEELIPALRAGKVVIADRCHFWSAVAYGLWENNVDYDLSVAQSLLVTHGVVTKAYQFMIPDITFYLDISVPTVVKRLSKKGVKKEIYEKEETLRKIKKGYDWLLKEFPEAFTIIDAEESIEEISKTMIKEIQRKMI